jgi:bifunctional non-homologous end joining protein LigD
MGFQRKKPAAIGVKAPYPEFIAPHWQPRSRKWRAARGGFTSYRVQAHLRDAAVKVFTRRGNDWTHRFQKISADAWHIKAGSAIIDGEVVVRAANGTSDFSVLRNELKGKSTKIVMVAFDLLYLNGYDLRKLPLIDRKALLKKIIAGTDVQFSESFEVDGREMYQHACSLGLQGVVSRSARASIIPDPALTGLRLLAPSARRCRSRGFPSRKTNLTDSMSAGKRATA